jgi:NCS2 family nucleobase:cation symporter-2
MTRAFRADGLGILVGGIFNAFPYTSYSQNVGLVTVTGVRSRYACAAGGAILVFLGLLPKLGHLVAAIPKPVLGGAGLVMFGMVAANGIRILSTVDFRARPNDLFILAVFRRFRSYPDAFPVALPASSCLGFPDHPYRRSARFHRRISAEPLLQWDQQF